MLTITKVSLFVITVLLIGFPREAVAKVIQPAPTITPVPTVLPDLCRQKPNLPPWFYQVFQFPSSFTHSEFPGLSPAPLNVQTVLGGAKNQKWKRVGSDFWVTTYEFQGANIPRPLNADSGKVTGKDVYICFRGRLTLQYVKMEGSIQQKSRDGRTLSVGINSELLATISGQIVNSTGMLWLTDEMKGKSPKKDFKISQTYDFAGPQFPTSVTLQADKSIYTLAEPPAHFGLLASLPADAVINNPMARVYNVAINQFKCEASDVLGWQCARYWRIQSAVENYRFKETPIPKHFNLIARTFSTAQLKDFLDVPLLVKLNENTVDDEASFSDNFVGNSIIGGFPSLSLNRQSSVLEADNSSSHTVTYTEHPETPVVISVNCTNQDVRATCSEPFVDLPPGEPFPLPMDVRLDAAKRIESLLGGPGMGL